MLRELPSVATEGLTWRSWLREEIPGEKIDELR